MFSQWVLCAGVTEQLVDCSGGDDFTPEGGTTRKLAALAAVLQQNPVPRTMIFCNKIEVCRTVENFLSRRDRKGETCTVLACHAAIAPETRQRNLHAFLTPPQDGEPQRVLVCTDRCVTACVALWHGRLRWRYNSRGATERARRAQR